MASDNPRVEGKILYHNLVDWWFTVFTAEEREYIDNCYQPMGAPPHSLTKGRYLETDSVRDTALFLNGLATWFRSKADASIFQRIHEQIVVIGNTRPLTGVAYIRGRHYVTYVYDVENLRRAGKLNEAEKLLLVLIEAIEQQNKVDKLGVAPWYYEELAKIYRKNKDYEKEVSILERFAKQKHGSGVKPKRLLERLEKAKALLDKNRV